MDSSMLSIRLLGGFSVSVDGRAIPDSEWHHRKAAELVKLLALAPGACLPKERVIEALWPEAAPGVGGSRIRKVAFHARNTLRLDDGVVLAGGVASLAPEHRTTTDVERFTTAAVAALDGDDEAASRQAATRYGGELLPEDRYASWCDADRFRLRDLYLRTLAAGRLWGRLVVEDPTDERAHRELMANHLRTGNRAAAIRQYGVLRETLREELGISPAPRTAALYEQILALEGAPSPTPAERARALLAWAAAHWERSDVAETERTAIEVRALAVDAGLTAELTEASEFLGLAAYARGAWPEVFAREFLSTLVASPELAPFLFDANMCMSEFALGERDGPETVARLADQMLERGAESSSDHAHALGRLLRGEAGLLADADPVEVDSDLASAERSWPAEAVTGRVLTVARKAQLAARLGDRAAADRGHRQALELARRSAIREHLLPCIYGGMIEATTPGTADDVLAAATVEFEGMKMCDPCSMAFRLGAARVCADADEVPRGRTFCDEAGRVAKMWTGGPWHAAVLEARAHLDHAEGKAVTATAGLLQRAASGFLDSGRPREAERCRRALALWTGDGPDGPGNGPGTLAS